MADSARLDDLRRRVQKDPASIAFAQLAEELRRAGQYEESVDVCRVGLAIHPGYLSARVTLGRALMDLDRIEEARRELEFVRRSAPENLAAIRALADIHRRWGGTFGDEPVVVDPPPVIVAPPTVPRPDPPVSVFQDTRAARTLSALEQWLAAIHVARAQRNA